MAEEVKEEKKDLIKSGKVTKFLTQTSILGLFAVAGVIVLLITGALGTVGQNRGLILFLALFGFICLASILATPWVRNLERDKHKILSWIFVGFLALCLILWFIASFVVNGLINRVVAGTITDAYAFNTIVFVRIVLIITLQFVAANFIASNVLRYGKKMIAFQGVAYFSYVYIDLWLSGLMSMVMLTKDGGKYELGINGGLKEIVLARWAWTLAIIALVWVIVSNTIINSTNKNGELRANAGYDRYGRPRRRGLSNRILGSLIDRAQRQYEDEELEEAEKAQKEEATKKDDAQTKLAKLKEMYEQGLLTKEEYDEKRQKLIDEI